MKRAVPARFDRRVEGSRAAQAAELPAERPVEQARERLAASLSELDEAIAAETGWSPRRSRLGLLLVALACGFALGSGGLGARRSRE